MLSIGRPRGMAKFDPLRDYLRQQRYRELELTFREIEHIIGVAISLIGHGGATSRPCLGDRRRARPSGQRSAFLMPDAGELGPVHLQGDLNGPLVMVTDFDVQTLWRVTRSA